MSTAVLTYLVFYLENWGLYLQIVFPLKNEGQKDYFIFSQITPGGNFSWVQLAIFCSLDKVK